MTDTKAELHGECPETAGEKPKLAPNELPQGAIKVGIQLVKNN